MGLEGVDCSLHAQGGTRMELSAQFFPHFLARKLTESLTTGLGIFEFLVYVGIGTDTLTIVSFGQ